MPHQMVPIIPVDPSITLVHQFLERSARLYPDKVAVIHGKARATYGEIDRQASNFASQLIALNLRKGDRVCLLMENCLEYVLSYYGILKAGGVAVPLNSDLKPEGLRYAIQDLEAKIMVSSSRFEELIFSSTLSDLSLAQLIIAKVPSNSRTSKKSFQLSSLSSLPYAVRDFGLMTSPLPPTDKPATFGYGLSDADLASIVYTSGSTGLPKGVMLTHRNIVDNTFSICQYLHLTEKDVQMVVLPFFYVMGKSLLNSHFAVGGTVVINNQFAFPATVLKEMVREGATGLSGVPSTFAYLVHRSPLSAMRDELVSLRYVSQAGGHMARAIKEELRRILPSHTEIFIMYGATEASARLSYLDPSRLSDKWDSAGKAIPGVILKVVHGDQSETAVGEVGELIASGSNIMQGYWRKQEATDRALKDGWYYTGDQAYRDEEGFIFLVGRNDDLLKVGGHRLNPQEIEDILLESNLFVEAVVLGLPDEFLGNRLVALAVPAGASSTIEEAMSYGVKRLPKYKVPSEIRFIRSLPKKTSGKIDRAACVEIYQLLRNGS